MTYSRVHPVKTFLFAALTGGCVLAGLPASAGAATGSGVITGTVTFHESGADRTLEVYRQSGSGTWAEDPALETTVAPDGSYTVHAPAGEPVKLRASYGDHAHGYWYGDGFGDVTAAPVQADAGTPLSGVDLDVPAPAYVSGTVTDKAGTPIAATVVPMVNNDGGLRPLTDAPVSTTASGTYTVVLPADYDTALLGRTTDGTHSAWLGGGSVSEPNEYLRLEAGQRLSAAALALPVTAATPVKLRATHVPVVRGAARSGAVVRATSVRWNARPVTVRYQWLRNGRAIKGANSSAYRLKRTDVRKRVSVRVTARRAGTGAVALSQRTRLVRAR